MGLPSVISSTKIATHLVRSGRAGIRLARRKKLRISSSIRIVFSVAALAAAGWSASAQVVSIPPCCQVPSVELLPGLDLRARSIRGSRWFEETDLHYELRYNQAFTALLVEQPRGILVALEAMSDQQLCGGPCGTAQTDLRHVVEAAMSWKNMQESDAWNEKVYLLAFISTIIAFVSAVATVFTVDWLRLRGTRAARNSGL